jgi:hypothetical protein
VPNIESEEPAVREGELPWAPSAVQVEDANLTRFAEWLARERDLHFSSYDALWQCVEQAANRNAMANPDSLDFFVNYAKTQNDYSLVTGQVSVSEKAEARTVEKSNGR